MFLKIKQSLTVVLGFLLAIVGVLFIVLPGPAFIFLPLGLGLLSTQFDWAKVALKRSQRMMRNGAVKMDRWWLKLKHRD